MDIPSREKPPHPQNDLSHHPHPHHHLANPISSSSPSISRSASIQKSDHQSTSTAVSPSITSSSARLSRAPSISSGPSSISKKSSSATGNNPRNRSSNHHNNKANRPKDRHLAALNSIRNFLKGRSSYDVLPVSFRVIVLDTKLVVKPALDVMWQAGECQGNEQRYRWRYRINDNSVNLEEEGERSGFRRSLWKKP